MNPVVLILLWVAVVVSFWLASEYFPDGPHF